MSPKRALDNLYERRQQLNHSIFDLESVGFGLGSEVNEEKLEALKLEMWDVEEAIDLIERVLEGRDLP